jgi:hypothetical protein
MSDICISCRIPIPKPPEPVCLLADYMCSVCLAMAESCATPYWQEIRRAASKEYMELVEMKVKLMGG